MGIKMSQAFPSKWLRCEDLNKREVTVVIERVEMESMGQDGTDEKPVAYFKGHSKGLGLNKTNAGTIAMMLGDDTDEWLGKQVVLLPQVTTFQGRVVPCIRIRVPMEQPQPVAATAPQPVAKPVTTGMQPAAQPSLMPEEPDGFMDPDDIPF